MTADLAGDMTDGWQLWLDWQRMVCPDNATEIKTLEADKGRYLGYVRLVGRPRVEVKLDEPVVSIPCQYTQTPVFRSQDTTWMPSSPPRS